jgi:hypothetical protein
MKTEARNHKRKIVKRTQREEGEIAIIRKEEERRETSFTKEAKKGRRKLQGEASMAEAP